MNEIILIWMLIATGWSSHYAPGVMDKVIYNRTNGYATPAIRQDYEGFDGYAASRYPEEIDTEVMICPIDESLPCRHILVVDCAGVADGALQWMLDGNIWYEVDYDTAVLWDTIGYGFPVRIYKLQTYKEGQRYAEIIFNSQGDIHDYPVGN